MRPTHRLRQIAVLFGAAVCLTGVLVTEGTEPSTFRRGDANADGRRNVTDAVTVLRVLFHGAVPPCEKSVDVDGNGKIEVADAVYLLDFLFKRGPQPPEPFAECGSEPGAGSDLTCDQFTPCLP